MSDEESLHQRLMNKAYERWQADKSMSKDEFHDSLSAQERFAVHTGNFNYQVCNGGFSQWWDNRYGTPYTVEFLLRACDRIGTPTAKKVYDLLRKFKAIVREYDPTSMEEGEWEEAYAQMHELDVPYYDIDEQFLEDCNNHLEAGKW